MLIKAAVSEAFFENKNDRVSLKVCGVFSTAIYLQDDDANIVMIHDNQYGLLPFGISVNDMSNFLRQSKITVFSSAMLEKRKLIFLNEKVQIELFTQVISISSVRIPKRIEAEEAITRGIAVLNNSGKEILAERALGFSCIGNSGDLFAKSVAKALSTLIDGLGKKNKQAVSYALSNLLGLGYGLTPSMDDFLSAMLYTLRYAERCWNICLQETNVIAGEIYRLALEKTCIFSVPYLRAAANGQKISMLESVLDLTPCLLNHNSVEKLIRIGSSSGSEMLAGIIYGLKYLLPFMDM